ncbi:MAG: class I SAM-dependent methyltransferase [Candidatus Pacebacteria bacterium]|nr:class I SAM-dependent methyltransferase [Candidatus Paceibacterota bacterium]MCF7862443.1 class I SAM-dependent methyltransferase [Candidatus Paceibacterota bacterium]
MTFKPAQQPPIIKPTSETALAAQELQIREARTELLQTPEGEDAYRFILGTLKLNLPQQLKRKVPQILEGLSQKGILGSESKNCILELIQTKSSERLEELNNYWTSNEVGEQYSNGALEEDNSLKVFSEKISLITAELSDGDIVLDLGTGTGLSAKILVEATQKEGKNIKLFGTDISPQMLKNNVVKETYQELVVSDLQKGIPKKFRNLNPKNIISIGVATYFNPEGMHTFIRDMSSMISNDGQLCFMISVEDTEKLKGDYVVPIYEYGETGNEDHVGVGDPENYYHYYKKGWIDALLKENNLTVVDQTEYFLDRKNNKYPCMLLVCKKATVPQASV